MKARVIAIATTVTVILVFVIVFIVRLADQPPVEIWPISGKHSLMGTLFLTFGLGGLVGALAQTLFRMLRPERGRVLEGMPSPPVVRSGEREHPGRP